MVNNQLFKIIPPKDLVEDIIRLFGPDGFDENYYFSKLDIINNDIISKVYEKIPELTKYYLICLQIYNF